MSMKIKVLDWVALAPSLSSHDEWLAWSHGGSECIDETAPLPKCSQLPMMMARRLNNGSRLAVECGLTLYRRHQDIDAIVFSSRHGELERNQRILSELATQTPVSPTNFTMSVHNSAVGTLSIITKTTIPTSAISAGQDSFQQGLYEVLSLLLHQSKRVLFVDFDGDLPEAYNSVLPETCTRFPYACAFLLSSDESLTCSPMAAKAVHSSTPILPQSIQFIAGLLSDKPTFCVIGEGHVWQWHKQQSI
ncbi:TPA: beta-ketoacyl synthase chain length factor [Providencia alcalifaciens]|uniref:beta-ketoacyl synthase chain length factor n=1 Tax=Providencia alcalifaciens TaxID=126385 RepID=UPI002B052D42|nr:beta-ketoacyl synthase chain length factor [Providencia alcalifaciens]